MNTAAHFRNLEDDQYRGDRMECVDWVDRGIRGEMVIPGVPGKVALDSWMLGSFPENHAELNLFCMYAFRPAAGSYPVDVRNFECGDSVLVVTEPQVFFDRVRDMIRKRSLDCRAGLVEYVPESYKGEMGAFKKFHRFDFQSEWRIVCYGGDGDVRKEYIGSIRDISEIHPSEQINDLIAVR